MPQVVNIPRANLKDLLDRITVHPEYIFSVTCNRRRHLYLRYPPINDFQNGPFAHQGDRSNLFNRRFIQGSNHKIVLEPAGATRTMIVKRKTNDNPMKHWQSQGGQLAFDPTELDLYLVAGIYNDEPKNYGAGKRIGRHGSWRPWCLIDLRTTRLVKYSGVDYHVD